MKENDVLAYNGEEWVNVPLPEVVDKYEWNVNGGNVNGNGDKKENN